MHLLSRKPLLALFLLVMLGSSLAFAQNGATVNFSLRTTDGQTITSDSLRGEVVVLAFGASWLPLSKAQLQGVRKLADEYSDRGVVVYWVSTESEDPKSKNYASDDNLRRLPYCATLTAQRRKSLASISYLRSSSLISTASPANRLAGWIRTATWRANSRNDSTKCSIKLQPDNSIQRPPFYLAAFFVSEILVTNRQDAMEAKSRDH